MRGLYLFFVILSIVTTSLPSTKSVEMLTTAPGTTFFSPLGSSAYPAFLGSPFELIDLALLGQLERLVFIVDVDRDFPRRGVERGDFP